MDSWSAQRRLRAEERTPLLTQGLKLPGPAWDERLALDAVLPSQWCGSSGFGPCERLMLEVLAGAFHTVMARTSLGGHRNTRAFRETALWFEQPNLNAPVNLSDCCDALGLDVGCVQAAARRLMCPSRK
jgi:hypothetical protein